MCAYIISVRSVIFNEEYFPRAKRLHNFPLKERRKTRAENEPTMSGEEEIGRMMISQRDFVGRDREVRRCVFHAHSSEIEWNGT